MLLTALASIGVYLLFLVYPYPLLSLYDTPLLDLGKIANHAPTAALRFALGYALIFALYAIAYRAALRIGDARAVWLIVGAALAFALTLLWVYPLGAADVYDYIFRARLWTVYDYNPHTVAPLQVSADAWSPYVVWVWFTSPYGPVWTYLSYALVRLGGNSLLTNLLLFKLLSAACLVVAAWLIFDLLRARGTHKALGGVLLFAWNPLLLFESVVNAHNDIVMMTLLLAALWLYQRRRWYAAVVVCLLAALAKVAALVSLPLLLLACLRSNAHRWRRVLVASIALCALVTAALYAPLWRGVATLSGIQVLDNRFTSSLAAIVKLSLEASVPTETAEKWARGFAAGLFAPLYLYQFVRTPARPYRLQKHIALTLGLFLLIATLWFQPWYVVWLIALAPLVDARQQRLALIASASALGTYLVFNFVWVWYADFLNARNELVLNVVVVLVWLGPLLLSEALHQWRRRRARRVYLIERFAP